MTPILLPPLYLINPSVYLFKRSHNTPELFHLVAGLRDSSVTFLGVALKMHLMLEPDVTDSTLRRLVNSAVVRLPSLCIVKVLVACYCFSMRR
jgi:hypothetical protein